MTVKCGFGDIKARSPRATYNWAGSDSSRFVVHLRRIDEGNRPNLPLTKRKHRPHKDLTSDLRQDRKRAFTSFVPVCQSALDNCFPAFRSRSALEWNVKLTISKGVIGKFHARSADLRNRPFSFFSDHCPPTTDHFSCPVSQRVPGLSHGVWDMETTDYK